VDRLKTSRSTRDLPAGTVTFLFTDVEGSTRLLQEHAASYAQLLDRQRRLIRDAAQAESGIEVDTAGDALFLVFRNATEAARGAASAQLAILSEDWPEGATVRVRMGLHTGEGRLGMEGYVGIDVHRGARIGAAAHGGEILLSEPTRSLIEGAMPAGYGWRDLGHHHLKDLDRPERLAQLLVPGLPQDFPPPRSIRRSGLPIRLSSFIGRGAEIEDVRGRLRTTRLLTLTGPGGTGKTRLALAVAALEDEHYPDGAVFVDLATLVDPALVPSAIASTLEIPPVAGFPVAEAVARHLAERRLFLVLDNFEQVLPAAAFVGMLLAQSPGLSVVVTSRSPLRIEGEQEWPVPPLGLPEGAGPHPVEALSVHEAIQLFTERAHAVQPSFDLTEDNASAVLDICRRLEGIPLAIELAAARVRLMPPAVINQRLSSVLDLGGGGRDTPERQRTLRGVVAWSVDLLEAPDRELFRRLSTFRGGWTMEAAERIVGGPAGAAGVMDGLERLFERSLIRSDPTDESRWTMLEIIRAFAAEQLLASGEVTDIARLHEHYYMGLAEDAAPKLLGQERDEWLDRLGRDHANLRTAIGRATETGDLAVALRIAASLLTFWHLRNHMTEGRATLDGLLAGDLSGVPSAIVAAALGAAGELATYQADYPTGYQYTSRSLALFRRAGDPAGTAHQLSMLGWVMMMPEPQTALGLFEESLQISAQIGAEAMTGDAHLGSGVALFRTGRLDESRERASAAVAAFEASGERYLRVYALATLGLVDLRQGYPREAVGNYAEGLRVASDAGASDVLATALDFFADLLLDRGDRVFAVRLAAAGEQLRMAMGGATGAEMIGVERPLIRASRIMDEATYGSARIEGTALTAEDATREALAFAARVAAGAELLSVDPA
jgi:predicted ATPase/class 3 adenylate cyclase